MIVSLTTYGREAHRAALYHKLCYYDHFIGGMRTQNALRPITCHRLIDMWV